MSRCLQLPTLPHPIHEWLDSYVMEQRGKEMRKSSGDGTAEMAQGMRSLADLPEDPASIPSTHAELTAICNSSSRRPFWGREGLPGHRLASGPQIHM